MAQGNFSSFQYYDNNINGYLEDAWNGFQTLRETKGINVFAYLAENDINYNDLIWVDIIDAMKIGHNNATLAVTMRNMQMIAKDGWDAYAARQTKKEDPTIQAAADIARSLLSDQEAIKSIWNIVQGVNFDDKCPHGLPCYTCMPSSH